MPFDWNISPDFHLLFLPRSGSHMLVNALNSHPDLDCSHSDQGHRGKGPVKGHAQCVIDSSIKKAIVLTRNSKDRVDSMFTDMAQRIGDNHTKEELTVKRLRPEKAENRYVSKEAKYQIWLKDAAEVENTLFVAYEDITGNQSITEIPEDIGRQICAFLGVEYQTLTTEYKKPKVIEYDD